MSLSVGAFNGGLNLLLLLVHLSLALLAERTYSLAARAQLHLTRATAATDVSQLRVSHWGSAGVRWLWLRLRVGKSGGGGEGEVEEDGRGGARDCDDAVSGSGSDGEDGHATDCGGDESGDGGKRANRNMLGGGIETKAEPDGRHRRRRDGDATDGGGGWRVGRVLSWSWAWVVALAAGLVALFPAELILETGLDARRDCAPTRVFVTDGVCASRSLYVPDAAASVATVLAAHLNWVDKTWTVVPEGAAKSMVTSEVRVDAAAVGRVLTANCALTTTPCTDVAGGCGEVKVQNKGGARGFVTVDSSLRQRMQSSSSSSPSSPAAAAAAGAPSRAQLPRILWTGPPVKPVTVLANSTAATATAMEGRDSADAPTAASGGTSTTGGDPPSGAPTASGPPASNAATGGDGTSSGAATDGSRLPPKTPDNHGDLVFTSSYVFWPATPSAVNTEGAAAAAAARGGHPRERVSAHGVEAVLTLTEFGRINGALQRMSTAPLTFPVRPKFGRVYNISCDSDGLYGGDLAAAASVFRTMQLNHPSDPILGANATKRALPPPLTVDAVHRGVFAWKTVDSFASCSAPVAVYTECGVMNWHRAVPLAAVVAALLGLYAAAVVIAWDVPRELFVPNNAAAWQRLAMAAGSGAGGGAGGGDGGVVYGGSPHYPTVGTEVDSLSAIASTTGGGGGGTAVEPRLLGAHASPPAGAPPTLPREGGLLLPLPGNPVAHQTPHGSVYVVLGDA